MLKYLIMKDIDIREKRKFLKLTQEELAELIGVSLKTISNYEKGHVIPQSKKALLHKILSVKSENLLEEPPPGYSLDNEIPLLSIPELEEEIKARKQVIKLLNKDDPSINHELTMINLKEKILNLLKSKEKYNIKSNIVEKIEVILRNEVLDKENQ